MNHVIEVGKGASITIGATRKYVVVLTRESLTGRETNLALSHVEAGKLLDILNKVVRQ